MRILEARDGFIKFESNVKVAISSFLEIEDIMKKYIAQVVKITNLEGVNVGYAKILYLYDGSLYEYDKTLPESGATIKPFNYENFREILQCTTPVKVGYFIDQEKKIEIDAESFNKKMLISIDSNENCDKLTSNLKQEFSALGNVLVIDMLGLTTGRKFTASIDFKLPLNTSALEFMYEECLKDATSESKDLVKEIFADLSEYSKTVPFLPFGTLKTIIDDMVNKSHIFKLLILKNKLAKFDREGYFAATVDEANNLNRILEQKEAVIDLSKLDSAFQNRYLSSIYSAIAKLKTKPQVFVIASNAIDKRNLKTVMMGAEITSTFITHSRFKYINEIKTMFTNFIIEPSFNANEVFKTYKTFLDAMPKDTYLIIGDCTNFIPLVSYNKQFIEETIIETSMDKDIDDVNYSELEEALNDPQTEAIDKKSEDLIEKISEDLETENSEELNIFDLEADDENSEEDSSEDSSKFSTKVHPSIDSVINKEDDDETEEVNEKIVDSNNESFEEKEEDIILENNSDIENEVETEVITKEEEQEAIEEGIETVELATEENEEQEIVSEPEEEIIEVEVPDDISDLTEEVLEETPIPEAEDVQNTVLESLSADTEELSVIEPVEIEEQAQDIQITTIDEISDVEDTIYEETALEELENNSPIEIESESIIDEISEEDVITEVIPISDEEAFDEIVELDPNEISEDDIIIDFTDDEIENEIVEADALDKEIAEDVDKVFTTIKDDSISDSDLDFIDELNEENQDEISEEIVLENNFEELPELEEEPLEDSFVEPLEEINEISLQDNNQEILETKSSSTPIVPVYEAEIPQEDKVESDDLEQGDSVIHAKYGNGIVEKMIKYGSKTLYSINFDNIGRRLLDPTLTEIKKV